MPTVTLAGVEYLVSPLPLGRLKIAIPAFGRAGAAFARGDMGEETLNDVALIISAGIGKTPDEVEQIPATLLELAAALEVIAEVSGLKPAGGGQGEGKPAVAASPSTGTTSTAG